MRVAILRTFERSAVVYESAFLNEVLRLYPGQLTVSQIRRRFEDHGVVLRDEGGKKYVTVKEVLREERDLVELVKAGRGSRSPLLSSSRGLCTRTDES